MQTSQGYIFHILQHFTTKLCNFTNFRMLFNAVVMNFTISKFQSVHYAISLLTLVWAVTAYNIILAHDNHPTENKVFKKPNNLKKMFDVLLTGVPLRPNAPFLP